MTSERAEAYGRLMELRSTDAGELCQKRSRSARRRTLCS